MKIKFPEYVRLHKIITGVSEIGIWEMLRDHEDFTPLLEKVPDEFFQWLTEVKDRLKAQFAAISIKAEDEFAKIKSASDDGTSRAQWAERIKTMEYPAIGFAILDVKPYAPIIWKMIRPHGKSIYKIDIDL